MAVPDFQTLMLPFLNVMADQKEHTFSEVETTLSTLYGLAEEERTELEITWEQLTLDGDDLADLMIDYNVGVSVAANYEIKRIDSDYFVEKWAE